MAEHQQLISDHRNQLLSADIPELYWETLFTKLNNEVFDANEYFTLVYDEACAQLRPVVTREDGIKKNDPNSIFLIDHAWTYEVEYARAQLKNVPGLAQRMANLMNLMPKTENSFRESDNSLERSDNTINAQGAFFTKNNDEVLPNDNMIELIFQNTWRFNQTYQIKTMKKSEEDPTENGSSLIEQVSFWYIMDEFGSKITHSDSPTWNIRSFHFHKNGLLYSVMFPVVDLDYGDAVTRDFAAGISDPVLRAAALYPWCPVAFNIDDATNIDINIDDILFSNKERVSEVCIEEPSGVVYMPKKECYNVYTDIPAVATSLEGTEFQVIDDPNNADILWGTEHIKKFGPYQEAAGPYINQFPSEHILTCKDLLSRVVERVGILFPETRCDHGTTRPVWFQQAFNLYFELPQFVANFLKRQERNQDNTWIIKPWNLGRSLDTHVSQDLNHIIRLRETGPKIAFKYIHNPVLLERETVGKVKFHFRYMPAVTSIDPLIIDIDEVFWIGCANKAFSLDNFNVYEKHFTTMNYRNDVKLKQIHYHEFIEMFNKQYPDFPWSTIQTKVHKIIRQLFEAAKSEPAHRGIQHCKISRAYYALDFMLKWEDNGNHEMQPVLLEVNYNPDCNRLVKYYPKSFYHLFTSLFLGNETPWKSTRL